MQKTNDNRRSIRLLSFYSIFSIRNSKNNLYQESPNIKKNNSNHL